MELQGPIRYRLSIPPPSGRGSFQITAEEGKPNFTGLAAASRPKLYVVTARGEQAPIYVGITRQSMRRRLRFGWTAKGQSGYYGYHWRHHYEEVALDLWCDMSPPEENPMLDVETVEAEVVFLIRQMGQWPRHQTEIHFHSSNPRHREIAKEIVSRYFKQG